MEIRKIHTGLPKLIVNTLVNIVHNDLNSIDFDNEEVEEIWKEIEKENKFKKLLKKATKEDLEELNVHYQKTFSDYIEFQIKRMERG